MLSSLKTKIKKIEDEYNYIYDSKITIEKLDDKTICRNGLDGVDVPIVKLRPYQQKVRDLIVNGKIKRVFDVMPRRAGKEVESWQIIIECSIRKPGIYGIVYPTRAQGEKVIWKGGITLEDDSLMSFKDMIPKFIISGKPNSVDLTICLWNGSVIHILGSDRDVDKYRGTNFRGMVFSEFAYEDPGMLEAMMPAVRNNDGWIILQTTFNGMNHAYNYMQEVKDNPEWFTRIKSVENLVDSEGKRYISEEKVDADRRDGMAEFKIQQEYYNVVSLNEESMYFAKAINQMYDDNRIRENCIIPGEPVYTSSDLGQNDETVIILFQLVDYKKPNIIHSISGRYTPYVKFLNDAKEFCTKNNLILLQNFAPHDAKNANNTTVNLLNEVRLAGFDVKACEKPSNKLMEVQNMRNMLYSTTIDKCCKRLITCLSNYSKEYDKKMGDYKNKPRHDWASHGVDAFQTLTIAIDNSLINIKDYGIVYYNKN
jgi:hypothetical protein